MEIERIVRGSVAIVRRSIRKIRVFFGRIIRKFKVPSIPPSKDGKVFVNLGCGLSDYPGYINIDARGFEHVHHVGEIQTLPMFEDSSVDLLYASHVIEHIDRKKLPNVLEEWLRVLKPGGTLRFGVPDFDGLVKIYEGSGRDVGSIVDQLLGQGEPYDDHHTIWNFEYAKRLLESVGYENVRRWDPQSFLGHAITDKTKRFAEINGKQVAISLNIEASKPQR